MIYQISAGQGPAECELGVAKLLAYLQSNLMYLYWIHLQGGTEAPIGLCGSILRLILSDFIGSIRWICRSPYRPEHRRKKLVH